MTRVVTIAVVLVVLAAGVALAWTSSTTNPGNSVTAVTLSTAGTPLLGRTPAAGITCTSVNLSWTASPEADRYMIERDQSGVWTTLVASHTTTSYTDTPGTPFTHYTIKYRITPKLSTSMNWVGPSTTAAITCGIGDVDDLAISAETCNDVTLTWTAAAGATRYDVWRSINGVAFTAVAAGANLGVLTYNDVNVPATAGQSVRYLIRTDDGMVQSTVDGNIATVASFNPFRLLSVSVNNTGAANSVNAGDNVVLTFSKASNGVAPAGTNSTNIFVQTTGGSRGLWFASGAASAANAAIGGDRFAANITGTSQAMAGTAAWSNGNTTWTWNRVIATAIPLSNPAGWGTFSPSTRTTGATNPSPIKCSNGSLLTATSAPIETGWF